MCKGNPGSDIHNTRQSAPGFCELLGVRTGRRRSGSRNKHRTILAQTLKIFLTQDLRKLVKAIKANKTVVNLNRRGLASHLILGFGIRSHLNCELWGLLILLYRTTHGVKLRTVETPFIISTFQAR